MLEKTNELTGAALDWAVCEATGFFKGYVQFRSGKNFLKVYGVARNTHLHPSTNWAQGGPIIERTGMHISRTNKTDKEPWAACVAQYPSADIYLHGATPLVAAMRCYVAYRWGDEVDVPEELR
jgi:hypothetical protein